MEVEGVPENALGRVGGHRLFTVELWTGRGLVRYHVLFVLKLATRELHIAGLVPEPDEAWMKQVARNLTDPIEGFLRGTRLLLYDRAGLFIEQFRQLLACAQVEGLRLPARPPNLNAFAERFGDVRLPVFVAIGSRDAGFTRTWFRHTIYDKLKSQGTCLIIFKDAEHFTFGDPLQPRDRVKTEKFHPLILAATTAFWNARLRNDPAAKAWLDEGGISTLLNGMGKFKLKSGEEWSKHHNGPISKLLF